MSFVGCCLKTKFQTHIMTSHNHDRVLFEVLLLKTRRILPNMGYIGMCGPKGYGFSAVLVINRVSILADFGHFGHK